MKLTPANPEYAEFLSDLKNRIAGTRVSAGRGKSVVDRLTVDIQKVFSAMEELSPSNFWRMRQFYASLMGSSFSHRRCEKCKVAHLQ
ncbi:MAG: hypothetical protein U9O82_05520 [Thermodesulfobacteriota bacterium]|nr:hypothetical protein [Thermodesulfobacteriota bacterium]